MLSCRHFAWQIHIKTWKGCLLLLSTPRCWYTTAASDDATTPHRAGEQEDEQAMEEHQEAEKPRCTQRALKSRSLALWQQTPVSPLCGNCPQRCFRRDRNQLWRPEGRRTFLTGRVNESLEHSLSVGSSAATHQYASMAGGHT